MSEQTCGQCRSYREYTPGPSLADHCSPRRHPRGERPARYVPVVGDCRQSYRYRRVADEADRTRANDCGEFARAHPVRKQPRTETVEDAAFRGQRIRYDEGTADRHVLGDAFGTAEAPAIAEAGEWKTHTGALRQLCRQRDRSIAGNPARARADAVADIHETPVHQIDRRCRTEPDGNIKTFIDEVERQIAEYEFQRKGGVALAESGDEGLNTSQPNAIEALTESLHMECAGCGSVVSNRE